MLSPIDLARLVVAVLAVRHLRLRLTTVGLALAAADARYDLLVWVNSAVGTYYTLREAPHLLSLGRVWVGLLQREVRLTPARLHAANATSHLLLPLLLTRARPPRPPFAGAHLLVAAALAMRRDVAALYPSASAPSDAYVALYLAAYVAAVAAERAVASPPVTAEARAVAT